MGGSKVISVVVPIGPGRIASVIEDLKNQEERVEIIIEAGTNTSRNRNNGIRKAKGEIIAFVNGHTGVPRDWSRKVRKFFEDNSEVDILGGPMMTPKDDSRFGILSGYALTSKFGAGNVTKRYEGEGIIYDADENMLTSANLAARKKVFEKVLFDEKIYPGEDPKFVSDCQGEGFKLVYNSDIFVYNKRRGDWKGLAQQIFNYGEMRPKKEGIIETFGKPQFLVPSLFISYIVLFAPLALIHWIFLIPGIFYLFLGVSFSIFEGLKRKDSTAIFILPLIFLTIHVSYGLGFINGTIRK